MKEISKISESKNYNAINLGKLNELMDYSLIHPVNNYKIEGKVFLKEALKSTGCELSFNLLPAKTELPYFHIHYKNEETYIILKGSGFFQVEDDCFEISEGSIIRVEPKAIRGLCNSSNETMIYQVIQTRVNSLEEYTTNDGKRVEFNPKWGM